MGSTRSAGAVAARLARGVDVEPEVAMVPWLGWKVDAPSGTVDRGPVDRHAGDIQRTQGREERGTTRLATSQRTDDQAGDVALAKPVAQGAQQHRVSAELDEDVVPVPERRPGRLGEAHGIA